jgi:hypothetical protein
MLRKREESMDQERQQLLTTLQQLRGQMVDKQQEIDTERREIK